jgi:hypothetical protein
LYHVDINKGVEMAYSQCEHPLDKVRVFFEIKRWGNGFKVETPRAHCTECNSHLLPTDKHGILAIDLVMAENGRQEKNEAAEKHGSAYEMDSNYRVQDSLDKKD